MTSAVSMQMPLPGGALKSGETPTRPVFGKDSGGRAVGARGEPEVTPAALRHEVSRINNYIRETRRDLVFRIDEDSGRTVITVTNPVTQEVIRQIPPERLLKLAGDFEQGGLFLEDLA